MGSGKDQSDSKAEAADDKMPKRLPPSSVRLQIAGDMALVRCPDRSLVGLFRRYEALFEAYANMNREERLLNYKMICALILTSHAKKTTDVPIRKTMFDLKNDLYLDIANDRDSRRKVAFRYLVSRNFRVIKFCDSCTKKNTEAELKRHQWKFCERCEVDRSFYNVLSMHHKFAEGSATLFLSHDLVDKIRGFKVKHKGKLEGIKEEANYQRYIYNVRNLDAINLDDTLKWYAKLLGKEKSHR